MWGLGINLNTSVNTKPISKSEFGFMVVYRTLKQLRKIWTDKTDLAMGNHDNRILFRIYVFEAFDSWLGYMYGKTSKGYLNRNCVRIINFIREVK